MSVYLSAKDSMRLRFQLALEISFLTIDRYAPEFILDLAKNGDVWMRRAIASASPAHDRKLLKHLLLHPANPIDENYLAMVRELARVVGAEGNPEAISQTLSALQRNASRVDDSTHVALLTALAQGLRAKGTPLATYVAKHQDFPELQRAATTPFKLAVELVRDPSTPAPLKNEAIELLAEGSYETVAPPLFELMRTAPDHALRQRALASLAMLRDPQVGALLLENLDSQTPAMRGAIFDALLMQSERTSQLLDAIEAGRIKPGELGQLRVNRLAGHREPAIQKRAKQLLAAALPADRQQALEKYQVSLTLEGEPRRGREVFRKNCATCHKVAGVGVDVGPSIADTYNKKVEQLLADILQPSRAIDNNFVSYAVTTNDGVAYVGIVVAETPASITLKLPEAKTVSLLRSEIDEMRSTGQSLMPDGLEKNITPQEMADCLTFLKNWRYLETVVPGVSPKP
jgi:putative heme-binding domain-containing protein